MEVQEQCSPLTKRKHHSVIKKLHKANNSLILFGTVTEFCSFRWMMGYMWYTVLISYGFWTLLNHQDFAPTKTIFAPFLMNLLTSLPQHFGGESALRSCQSISIGLKSELWLGHSKIYKDFQHFIADFGLKENSEENFGVSNFQKIKETRSELWHVLI